MNKLRLNFQTLLWTIIRNISSCKWIWPLQFICQAISNSILLFWMNIPAIWLKILFPSWHETLNIFSHACTHANYIYTLNWRWSLMMNSDREILFPLAIFYKTQHSNFILCFTCTVGWLVYYCTNSCCDEMWLILQH